MLLSLAIGCFLLFALWRWNGLPTAVNGVLTAAVVLLLAIIVSFFRVPSRSTTAPEAAVVSPADGKVVAIENVFEGEYFKAERKQVSVFMSPLNVHVNYYPIAGNVTYTKYHPGKYLVAWHPKSSTDNERTTVVVEHPVHGEVLFRQIAGALARRICTYSKVGGTAEQGTEFGFIKFGSRVDILLPLNATVEVQLGQVVQGSTTVIAQLNK